MNRRYETRVGPMLVVGVLALASSPSAVRAKDQTMANILFERAPQIINLLLDDHKYANVGVLKFMPRSGSSRATDDSRLNLALAHRLSVALVLANRVQQPLGILRNPSSLAASIPGADHRTTDGRKKLFDASYPLAWGKARVRPDAFLTGEVELSSDLTRVTVQLQIVDPARGLLPMGETGTLAFKAETQNILESGRSYLLRGINAGAPVVEQVIQAAQESARPGVAPLADPAAPVRLSILYGTKVQKVEHRGGKAFVPEPAAGQNVILRLERTASTPGAYGVVLKVNGLNTLYREDLPDTECAKWVLSPGQPVIEVSGFQKNLEKAEPFEVLADPSSRKDLSYYAEGRLGQISMTVFREATSVDPPILQTTGTDERTALHLAATNRGSLPPSVPGDLAALRKLLREQDRDVRLRGPIAFGRDAKPYMVRQVRFQPYPVPVMAVTIHYLEP